MCSPEAELSYSFHKYITKGHENSQKHHLLEWAIKGKVAQFHLPYFKQIHLSIETRSKILAAIDPGKWKLQLFSLSK